MARSQAAAAAAMSRARSCVSQVKPSPMMCSVTSSGNFASSRASPVSQLGDLMNCTTPTGKPWPIWRNTMPSAAEVLPLPVPVLTISRALVAGLGRHHLVACRLVLSHLLGMPRIGGDVVKLGLGHAGSPLKVVVCSRSAIRSRALFERGVHISRRNASSKRSAVSRRADGLASAMKPRTLASSR